MRNAVVLFAVAGGLAVPAGWMARAQTKPEVKKVAVTPTRANSGVEMYKNYCAGCHGLDGKGHGPAAEALKTPPADLTMLKQKNGGKYPANKVSHIIEGGGEIRAHGSSDMPLWGPIFSSLDTTSVSLTKLRIANVVKYVESLQQ